MASIQLRAANLFIDGLKSVYSNQGLTISVCKKRQNGYYTIQLTRENEELILDSVKGIQALNEQANKLKEKIEAGEFDLPEKPKHGGKREGAGRPKAEPSKLVRVPVGLIPRVQNLIIEYRDLKKNK